MRKSGKTATKSRDASGKGTLAKKHRRPVAAGIPALRATPSTAVAGRRTTAKQRYPTSLVRDFDRESRRA